MTPELLMSITATHGLPLPKDSAAEMLKRLRKQLKMSNDEIFERRLTVTGRATITPAPAPWTMEDAGIACKDLEEQPYIAFRYRWARDYSMVPRLKLALVEEAIRLKSRERWPDRIRERRYLLVLCNLAILEEHNGWWIHRAEAWPALAGVDDDVWRRAYSRRYEAVRFCIENWCARARHHIDARLSRRENEGSTAYA